MSKYFAGTSIQADVLNNRFNTRVDELIDAGATSRISTVELISPPMSTQASGE